METHRRLAVYGLARQIFAMGLPRTPTCHCNLRQQLLASILCLLCIPTSLSRASSFRPHSIAVTDVKEDAQTVDHGPPATIASSILGPRRSNHAYVTLLYGEDYVLGVRVLGESIRMTGTTKDLVVLVSTGVTETSIAVLRVDLSLPLLHHEMHCLWGFMYTHICTYAHIHVYTCTHACAL